MGKKVSVSELRAQLGTLLDQLDQGQSHFVIERNNQEVAVLLSMEKFRDIMQMLELLNTLDYIETGLGEIEPGLDDVTDPDFPELSLLPPFERPEQEKAKPVDKLAGEISPSKSRQREGLSIEDVAAKLGIRIIK